MSKNDYKPDEKPSPVRYGQLRSYYAKLGVSNTVFRELFGTPANPKTNRDGALATFDYVKSLPKGSKTT